MLMAQLFMLSRRAAVRTGAVVAGLYLAAAAGRAVAQQVNACYVPSVGAIYLVGLTGLPPACLAPSHVAIAIGGGALADGSVTAVKLADGAVITIKLADGSVTAAKLGPDVTMVTAQQQGALAGTSGTPSGTNRYVTDADPRNANARAPTVHGSASHDATVASLSGGVVPAAQLGSGTASSTNFLRGDRNWAVAASAKSSGLGTNVGVSTTPAQIASVSVTFPSDGTAVIVSQASFGNAGSNFLTCSIRQDGSSIEVWTWDAGRNISYVNLRQSNTTLRGVTAGAHTYALFCAADIGAADTYFGGVVVMFFAATSLP